MSRPVKYILGAFVAVILLTGSFSGGLIAGWFLPGSPASFLPFANPGLSPLTGGGNGTPSNLQTLFKPFWDTWKIVNDQYVEQPVDPEKLMRGAIQGMLASLGDEHTSYMNPDEYRQANQPMNGEYEGIGATVDTTGKFLKIVSPFPGSPAEQAGLLPGDTILKVDGQDMTGLDGSTVLRKVLGPANSKVVLTIQREGTPDPFDVSIIRAKITMKSVEGKMIEGNIAYVQVSTFGEKTTQELKDTLTVLMAKNPKGLVLDLRNNGGGLLTTAIDVVSQFVGKGTVMYEVFGDGTRKTFDAKPDGLATQIPLIVLVNKGTASASEITAGAIQDYARGKLLGEITYGKGSVQNWIPLTNNEGAIRVTIARWLTPKERQINGIGLTPDISVALTDSDRQNKKDPQLDKAVELLKNGQ